MFGIRKRIQESLSASSSCRLGSPGASAGAAEIAGAESNSDSTDGAAAGASAEKEKTAETETDKEASEPYYGDQKLNPEHRPLRFNTKGMNNQQIDDMLRANPAAEVFYTDEEIKAIEEQKKNKTNAQAKPGEGDEKNKMPGVNGKEVSEASDNEVAEFFERTGLNQEQFGALPKETQERLVLTYGAPAKERELYDKALEEHKKLKTDIDTLLQDSIVAARVEELRTGKQYIARKLPPVSNKEMDEIDALLSDSSVTGREKARETLNKIIESRALQAVQNERSVAENKAIRQEIQQQAWKTLRSIGDLDNRLKCEIEKLDDVDPSDPNYKKGLGAVVEFLEAKKIGLKQISELGPEQIYGMYARHIGWDRERDSKLFEQGKKSLLEKLRNPKRVARTPDAEKASVGSMSANSPAEFNRQSLKAELIEGKTATYERLLDTADAAGNVRMFEELQRVFTEARRERMSKQR